MAKVQASMADDSSHRAVRLVAVDLDGTLLRDDGSVSPRVTDTLRAVQEAGIVVVCVSARNARSVAAVAHGAGVTGLVPRQATLAL